MNITWDDMVLEQSARNFQLTRNGKLWIEQSFKMKEDLSGQVTAQYACMITFESFKPDLKKGLASKKFSEVINRNALIPQDEILELVVKTYLDAVEHMRLKSQITQLLPVVRPRSNLDLLRSLRIQPLGVQ